VLALGVLEEPGAGKNSTCALLVFSVSLQMPHAFVNATSGEGLGRDCNVSWQDVDIKNCTVSVRRTLTRNGGVIELGEPKTKKSRRSIRLTPRAIEALEAHLERQLREIGILGDRYEDQELLFTTSTGGLINPSNLRQRNFARLLKEARLPHIRFHDLRHTCATLLLTQGTHPKYVQDLLGHATIAITLDTYSHVMPDMGDQTAQCRTRSPESCRVGVGLVSERAGSPPGPYLNFHVLPAN
jgi:integrase